MSFFKQDSSARRLDNAKRPSNVFRKFQELHAAGKLAVALLIAGLASMPVGWIPHSVPPASALPLVPSSSDRFDKSEWQPHGIYAAGELPPRYLGLEYRGSFVSGDAFVGEQTSGWYRASPQVALMIAGFPTFSPNRLEIEVSRDGQENLLIPFRGENPREGWARWVVPLPADADAFRIRASDATTSWGGWLCFTEPFAPSIADTIDLWMIWQTFGTVALALVLVLGPGIVWRAWRCSSLLSLLWVGPLWLALGGTLCWALGGFIPPSWIALVWVLGTLLGVSYLTLRLSIWQSWSSIERRLLFLIPICVLGAAAKAAFSGGPPGELYHGRISRTLEIGDRGDSRISFHTVQLVGNHLSPNEPEGAKYFAPWHFSARGPLAGLAAVPLVLALGNQPPLSQPEQPWVPFDPQGFAAYRIVMITLASLSLVALSALIKRIAGEQRAWIGAALLALSPFFWHELYFTWPKLITAAWVLGAFLLLLEGRAVRSGLWLGVAYLWHPLALLSTPFFNFWLLGERQQPRLRRFFRSCLFGIMVLAVMGAWLLMNGQNPSQGGFFQYFRAADGVYDAPAGVWWASRWASFANTFIPLHVLWCCAENPAFNAIGTRSSDVVQFFFQYWTAVPFAVGIATWVVLLPACFRGIGRHPQVAALTLIAPALLFIAYMGIVSTGIMRDGGHVLFLTGWVFLVWAAGDQVPAWILGLGFGALRASEVFAMMFVPSLAASGWRSNEWLLNDVFWLLIAAASLALLTWKISRPSDSEMNQPALRPEPAA